MKDKIILIQGALDIEIQYLVDSLENPRRVDINGYEFHDGYLNGLRIVVSKTLVGTINAAIATCIGIVNFKPDIVINQGIAGAHTEDLCIGDIVIGERCCNINAYKMPNKE